MTEATNTQPTPLPNDYTAGLSVPDELAPYYRRGALSEAELVALHSAAAKDWLYRRVLRPLRAEQAAWAEIERTRRMDPATRHERMQQTMPTVLATIREHESIFDVAARLSDRDLDDSERREYVHALRLAEARHTAEQVRRVERDRAYTERLTTCETCGTVQPASPISGSTLTTIEVAGRTARVCRGCALLVPVVRAERAAAELVDGATRRQAVERWLDGR